LLARLNLIVTNQLLVDLAPPGKLTVVHDWSAVATKVAVVIDQSR
tara:strand:- start:144059 stop:144193 length:135 start_codon:yes stop_codon:yes gene_type:complete